MDGINWLAVVAAALSTFLIGGLWYSPLLFGKPWMKTNGFTEETLKTGNPAIMFGVSGLFSLIMAANLAAFLNFEGITLSFAVGAALASGLGFATMGLGIVALFERRSAAYILINGGYLTVAFVVMGLIIGAWR